MPHFIPIPPIDILPNFSYIVRILHHPLQALLYTTYNRNNTNYKLKKAKTEKKQASGYFRAGSPKFTETAQ